MPVARSRPEVGDGGGSLGVAVGGPRQGEASAGSSSLALIPESAAFSVPLVALAYGVTRLRAWPGVARHISLGPREKMTLDKYLIFLGFCFLICK